ncbi:MULTISPECIES: hypothetical protein [Streptomyces]|uniref:Peptidoglycan-binding protein n=1 Tax=Streptomyces bangladeshensis TaxID=295352 RepID=A0ABN3BMD6_9ACTN|nr:hypothetical protein CFC35_40390 [Streptomyces sp. FBKL.4005]BCM72919.1 hypothetical protein EASAB2608_08253 [Streptomyces sp. EAS-AB2608]CUW33199.1 hypothetical protein TUE45_pSRTUE45c_0567 [Streptomyces reticuli]
MTVKRLALRGYAAVVAVAAATAVVLPAATAQASGTKLTHSQAAAKLRAAGVSWTSSGHCSDRNRKNCTSFSQINSGTVDGVIAFKRASGCRITITGGTETGHARGTYSHWNGYKVDITPTTCVTRYIKRHYDYIGRRGDGAPMYRTSAGNVYADEGNHWDITYK